MSVKPIIPNIDNNAKKQNINSVSNVVLHSAKPSQIPSDSVSFQGAAGFNPIVSTMDFIEAGGYAASFIIQDGLGFIAPRVTKGLFRGSKKTDEKGNPILDENGKQKREYNWQLARKEFIREIITGPSAFLIPMAMLAGIKKYFGSANNVKLNYIEGFKEPFTKYAKENIENIANGSTLDKKQFYNAVYRDVLEQSINGALPESEKLSANTISKLAEELTDKQLETEKIFNNKELQGFKNKKACKAKLQELGESVEDMFMRFKKQHVGGTTNEMSVHISTSKGVKGGSISELVKAMGDYFDDAAKNIRKALADNLTSENAEQAIKHFTNKRMGSRILTNLSLFGAVAAFYTQIPKLYKAGLDGNPALKGTDLQNNNQSSNTNKDVAFTGAASLLEKAGTKVFNNARVKKVSDIFEFNGNVMSGAAMPVLLYGFCIPPRLKQADDKYDYAEIVLRDMTSFTALLFGAKAIARLFSDGFTKLTGLALNQKDLAGRNILQKTIDYLNPIDKRHSVLTTRQLNSKYMNIDQYKGGISGFIDFIEQSGGNLKKALANDKSVKEVVEEILGHYNNKTYANASAAEIKHALLTANKDSNQKLINKFYNLFKTENGLLKKAKTCNSTFGFVSTIVLIPSFIIWLASACEKMTNKQAQKDLEQAKAENKQININPKRLPHQIPSMAGFLGTHNY